VPWATIGQLGSIVISLCNNRVWRFRLSEWFSQIRWFEFLSRD
jgi:hypothetical protein